MKRNEYTPHELLYLLLKSKGLPATYKGYTIQYGTCDLECEFHNATDIEPIDLQLIESLHCYPCLKSTCNRCVIRTMLDDVSPVGLFNTEYLCDHCDKQADIVVPDMDTEAKVAIINSLVATML